MDLSTSAVSAFPGDDIPATPDDLMRWLGGLNTGDPVQHARQFYAGLKQISRQPGGSGEHLSLLDGLSAHAAIVARQLRAAADSYPLSSQARETVQLNHALLAEVTAAYGRVLEKTTRGETNLTAADLGGVAHRALSLCKEQLLTTALVYAPTPRGLWRDIHRLYRLAERHGLLTSANTDIGTGQRATVVELYLRTALLALARPHSLRQGDIALLTPLFIQEGDGCAVSSLPAGDRAMRVYYADTSADAPPDYRDLDDAPVSAEACYFDLAPLIASLKSEIRAGLPAAGADNAPAHIELRRDVLTNLTTPAQRQFSRAQRKAPVFTAIGLDGIHRAVSDDAGTAKSRSESWQSWHVVDLSAGGYCLAHRGSAASDVRVGELIAVREQFNDEYLWRIGVVRWLRCRLDRALETGIQLLAPKAVPVLLQSAGPRTALGASDAAIRALLLPPVRSIGQPPTLLTPPNRLHPGEAVLMRLHAQERRLRLTGLDGQSDCFSQFRYNSVATGDFTPRG